MNKSFQARLLSAAAVLSLPGVFATSVPGVMAAQAQASQDLIRRVLVEGNQRIEAATIQSYLSVGPGSAFEPEQLDLSLKALFATGEFADVAFERRGNDLVVQVSENPIVNRVLYEGNRALSLDTLGEEVRIKPRNVFTPARVQADVQRILELYRRRGRFAASVTPEYRPLSQNRVDLVFVITEGPTTGVRAVNFLGNESFSDQRLRGQIVTEETEWWRFFSTNANYDPDRLEVDRDRLRRFYQNQGYADFQVVSAVAELAPDRSNFNVTFTINEGPRYDFGDLKVTTALDKLDGNLLVQLLPIQTGTRFRGDLIERAEEALKFAAGSAGYPFVDVRRRFNRNPETGTLDIEFFIDEGPRVYIERINIVDNTQTLDRVIRREMQLTEGDAFNRVLLDDSRRRIRSLGIFKEVEITEEEGSEPDRAIVNVKVEEQPTGELNAAVGFSSVDNFFFDLSASQRNFLGRGQFVRVRWQQSSRTRQIDLRFREPRFMDRNLVAGGDLFATQQDFLEEAGFEQDSVGGGLSVGFPLTNRASINLRYRVANENVIINSLTQDFADLDGDGNLDDLDGDGLPDLQVVDSCETGLPAPICRQRGERLSSILGYDVGVDQRDDPTEPKNGYFVTFAQDLAGVGGEVRYLRTEAIGAVYHALFPDRINGLVLSGRFSAGHMVGWGGETIRINDRFFKGGDSFRGFDIAGVGPRQFFETTDPATGNTERFFTDAIGGKSYAIGTVELALPLGLPREYGLTASLFTEFGTVAFVDSIDAEVRTVGTTRVGVVDDPGLRASAGLSVGWDSPFGPVQFDFSRILSKEDFDRTETFRFSTRTRF
jgi:outer membrane protein insertion porin family